MGFETVDLEVCTVCIHIIANGEYNDGTDAADRCAADMVALWGDSARHMVPGCVDMESDAGFNTTPCESCGDPLAGDRFAATVLKPL